MSGQSPQPPNGRTRTSRTPAERAVEFTATQRRLKQEAADRRASAEADRRANRDDRQRGS
jgi:hypothetical protein